MGSSWVHNSISMLMVQLYLIALQEHQIKHLVYSLELKRMEINAQHFHKKLSFFQVHLDL